MTVFHMLLWQKGSCNRLLIYLSGFESLWGYNIAEAVCWSHTRLITLVVEFKSHFRNKAPLNTYNMGRYSNLAQRLLTVELKLTLRGHTQIHVRSLVAKTSLQYSNIVVRNRRNLWVSMVPSKWGDSVTVSTGVLYTRQSGFKSRSPYTSWSNTPTSIGHNTTRNRMASYMCQN